MDNEAKFDSEESKLAWACYTGRMDYVKRVFDDRERIENVDFNMDVGIFNKMNEKDNKTVFEWAIFGGNSEVVRFLLDKSEHLDVGINNEDNIHSIFNSMCMSTPEIFGMVCEKLPVGFDKHLGAPALIIVMGIDNNQEHIRERMKHVLKRTDVDINKKMMDGTTALSFACKCGDAEEVRIIMTREDLDYRAADNKGNIALHHACRGNHARVVSALLENHVQYLNQCKILNNNHLTPLSLVCQRDHWEIIKVIMEWPIAIQDHLSLLRCSIENKSMKCLKVLLENFHVHKPSTQTYGKLVSIAKSFVCGNHDASREILKFLDFTVNVNMLKMEMKKYNACLVTASSGDIECDYSEHQRIKAFVNEMIDFYEDPPKFQVKVRVMAGFDKQSADLLALLLLFSEEYFSLRQPSKNLPIHLVFSITRDLPLEIKMMVTDRVYDARQPFVNDKMLKESIKQFLGEKVK